MASPSNRRPGYSRRAQYTTFFGYFVGVLGVLVGVLLLLVSIFAPEFFSGPRNVASASVEPAGGLASRSRSTGRGVFETIEGYVTRGNRVAKMRRELAETRTQLAESDAIAAENRRLKRLLGLTSEDLKPVAVTRLTTSTASSTRRFATIGAGSNDGVTKGMPVRSELGLVGRVLEVGGSSARVLLVTDSASVVPVRRAKDNIAAFAQGRGDGSVQIKLLDLGINPLKKNDIFVTSGTGGLYQAGTPIAVVESLTRDGAFARVLSNPAATRFVTVEPVSAIEEPEPTDEQPPVTEDGA